jgi:plasmid stability protein
MADAQKRATVYLDPAIHRALRIKSAETDRSVSELINEALRASLAEDADDLEAFELREREPDLPYEDVVRDLRRRGKV